MRASSTTTERRKHKYILRTDVMYERTPAVCDLPEDRIAYALYCEATDLAGNGRAHEALPLFAK